MKSEVQIRAFILKALNQTGGLPLPDATLRDSIRLAFPHLSLSEGMLHGLIKELDSEGFIRGVEHRFTKLMVWDLTTKGQLQVQEIP